MNILITHSNENGVDYHRMIVPFEHLNRNGHTVYFCRDLHSINIGKLEGKIDVVVFNRNCSGILQPDLIFEQLRSVGIAVVMDMDDHWELPKNHVLFRRYKSSNFTKCQIDQMKHSDAVICTHNRLRKEIINAGADKKSVFVARNAIDPQESQFKEHSFYYHDSVYWQGSPTHYEDLKLIGKLDGLPPNIFHIAGFYNEDPEWNRIKGLFPKAKLLPATSVLKYAKYYNGKGICLIPLVDNKFNSMKSELKMIEAGYFSKCVVVSDVHPYKGIAKNYENCITIGNNQNWKYAISGLLNNKNKQDDLRLKLKELVDQKYLIHHVNHERETALDFAIRRSKKHDKKLAKERLIYRLAGSVERDKSSISN